MTDKTTAVSIKAMTDTHATVAGYGVVFGAIDLTGETFTPDTDFMIGLVPSKPVLYDHALGTVKHFIGSVKSVAPDEYGLWVEAELERNTEYVTQVIALAEKGALGWSSGTAGHLTRRDGSIIKRWPLIEFSLTPTPAEPRTLGVEVLKSLIECDASFEALLPKGDAATSPAGANDVAENAVNEVQQGDKPRENEMSEEVKAVAEAPAVDIGALVAEVKSLRDMLEKQPPVNAPALNLKTKFGDDETKAIAYFIRTGDRGALGAIKASNDTDMNIGTPADGGNAVPTGHYQGIIARRDEDMLAAKLGAMKIPGVGLTVNVPIDDEADGEFITKAEATAYDRDAPALGTVAMTLVKYTKSVEISDELLADQDSNLLAFLNNFIGRAMAKTYNQLFIAELKASGTAALTLASATVIAASEIPALTYKLPAEYADNAAWIMSRTVEGEVFGLSSANDWQFADKAMGTPAGRKLWTYPVYNSAYCTETVASSKSLIFGNFSFVGWRDSGLTMLRNPYLLGNSGQVKLHYNFRTVFKVLQAEAIVFATHPSA